jgi:hypothetical protein
MVAMEAIHRLEMAIEKIVQIVIGVGSISIGNSFLSECPIYDAVVIRADSNQSKR